MRRGQELLFGTVFTGRVDLFKIYEFDVGAAFGSE